MSSSYLHTPLVAVVRSLGPVSPSKLSLDYGSSLSSLHPLESCFGICRLFSFYGFKERNTTSYGRFFYLDSLENWYYRILIVMTGNLQDAKIAVDSMSIWYVKYIALEINIMYLKIFIMPYLCCILLWTNFIVNIFIDSMLINGLETMIPLAFFAGTRYNQSLTLLLIYILSFCFVWSKLFMTPRTIRSGYTSSLYKPSYNYLFFILFLV